MPIGVIANCLGIIIGGIAGSFIGPRLTESFKTNLNLVFGACAMTMGISSISLMKNMPADGESEHDDIDPGSDAAGHEVEADADHDKDSVDDGRLLRAELLVEEAAEIAAHETEQGRDGHHCQRLRLRIAAHDHRGDERGDKADRDHTVKAVAETHQPSFLLLEHLAHGPAGADYALFAALFRGIVVRVSAPLLGVVLECGEVDDRKDHERARHAVERVFDIAELRSQGHENRHEKRGGDIDLLVRSTGEKKGVLARIRMTARLKLHLGDQKIDVIGDHEDSPVVQEALKNGIQLI